MARADGRHSLSEANGLRLRIPAPIAPRQLLLEFAYSQLLSYCAADSLAKWSQAQAPGASLQLHGILPHS